jgi:divalent metal cation (Fe/Co/Zn/Cd) transporter
LKLAIHLAREALDILMEKAVSEEKLSGYAELVRKVAALKRIDRLRARELGHYIIVDVGVSIPAELTIQQGHDISREIKRAIMDNCSDVEEVLIHLNPWYEH